MLAASVRVPQHVVYRVFPVETVVLNLDTGKYHGLDPVAGHMFELLDRLGSVRDAAARTASDFEHPLDEVERDLCELCEDLERRGLIEIDAGE
jgi:hypothetical protein